MRTIPWYTSSDKPRALKPLPAEAEFEPGDGCFRFSETFFDGSVRAILPLVSHSATEQITNQHSLSTKKEKPFLTVMI
jgi:hypothetical protein